MPIDRSKMRRGAEAIEAANERSNNGGGTFKPFLQSIFWAKDQDTRTVLILNPMEEIPQVDYHPFVDIGDGKPHSIIARTDPIIGERFDPIEEKWLYGTRLTNLAIAVELVPVVETDDRGREKPVGFEVATRTFERAIRDEDGEPTDDVEEITVPEVGLIAQSPVNFFNQLRVIDASEGEINTLPLKVTRVGAGTDLSFLFKAYDSIKPDLSLLFDCIGELSYLGDQRDALLERLGEIEDDTEAAAEIGRVLLDLVIDEKGSEENYQELFDQITEPSRFPKKQKGEKKGKKERPARQSQRRASSSEDVTVAVTNPDTEEKPVARRRSADESASKASSRQERMEQLRKRHAKAAASEE